MASVQRWPPFDRTAFIQPKEWQVTVEPFKHKIPSHEVIDLARLVRLVPAKGIGLDRLRKLFQDCTSPEESKTWIDALLKEQPKKPPYKAILDTVWALQNEVPAEAVEFAAVTTALRKDKEIEIKKTELIELCKAMSRMAPQVVVREHTVELTQRPDKIIDAAGAVLQQFPEEEQKSSIFKVPNKGRTQAP